MRAFKKFTWFTLEYFVSYDFKSRFIVAFVIPTQVFGLDATLWSATWGLRLLSSFCWNTIKKIIRTCFYIKTSFKLNTSVSLWKDCMTKIFRFVWLFNENYIKITVPKFFKKLTLSLWVLLGSYLEPTSAKESPNISR